MHAFVIISNLKSGEREGMTDKIAKKREDNWFDANEKEIIRIAREKRKKEEDERRAREKEQELKKLKDLHWMKCPKCGHDMNEMENSGIMVDECTFCGGIYFDLGELDTLLQAKISECRGFFKALFSK